MSMTINQTFETSLVNHDEEKYKRYENKIKSAINEGYSANLTGYINGSANVTRFRAGSIIADFTIYATRRSLDFRSANKRVTEILRNAGIPVDENSFAESEETILIKPWCKLYPLQTVRLTCPKVIESEVKWTVNGINLPLNTEKYSIDVSGVLTVWNLNESDRGIYSCIVQGYTIPRIYWQEIVIEHRPNIIVGKTERVFQCRNQTIQLTCCSARYDIRWKRYREIMEVVEAVDGPVNLRVIPPRCDYGLEETTWKDESSDILIHELENKWPVCIKLNYTILDVNCGEIKPFTCYVPHLQYYSYGMKSITVTTSRESFDCHDEMHGGGRIGDQVTAPCEEGFFNVKVYQCEKDGWKEILDECVIQEIAILREDVESLFPEQIPLFMNLLSNVTKENIDVIQQSGATVKTIVEILHTIAIHSQRIFIHQAVMNNFLRSVETITSDKTIKTWETLNNRNTTGNTSSELLLAIEIISERLTNDNFTITESSIQLNRTTIKNAFDKSSYLPNSTTQIVIPKVPEPTLITIIVFSNLDNVLPARNTTYNGSGKSDVRINGDVVVIKVNQTINNISFTFDITDESLGNAQCVFWNFDLNGWDSTGCIAKPSGSGKGKVTCECNHTTSFSILMSPFTIKCKVLDFITYIGVAISMASLILCLFIEIIVWKSVTTNVTSYIRHVSVVNIAVSLLIANICFMIGAAIAKPEQDTPVGRCSPVVFFMHFFYLALFFWMLFSALFILYRISVVVLNMSRSKIMVIAFMIGYVAPLLIAVITVATTAGAQKYVSKANACWLNWFESKALLAFVIPALTIVAINLLVLIVVLCKMLRRGVVTPTQPDEKHALVVIARCVAILTPIFGLTWGFGIGTMVSSDCGIHVAFAFLNSLQGFFILLFQTLLDKKVREALAGKLSLKNLSSSQTRSTSEGASSGGLGFFQKKKKRNMYNISEDNGFSLAASPNSSSSSNN